MTKTFFDELADKREEAISELDRTKFGPMIRNHLVQLFRKAHAVEPRLTGVIVGMGRAFATGRYVVTDMDRDGKRRVGEPYDQDASDFGFLGGNPVSNEVWDFLKAVEDYAGKLCNGLGYINDITLDDLKTRSSEKAKVWKGRS